jgi:hypothetical protein
LPIQALCKATSLNPNGAIISNKKPPFGGQCILKVYEYRRDPSLCSGLQTKNKKPRVLWLTHSPRPAVRYRPLPTSLLCHSFLRNSQSAIFNQLALKLGLRAYRQPGKSVNTSGLLSLPLNFSCSPQPAVRYRPSPTLSQLSVSASSTCRRFQHQRLSAWPRCRDLAWVPVLATNRENF